MIKKKKPNWDMLEVEDWAADKRRRVPTPKQLAAKQLAAKFKRKSK